MAEAWLSSDGTPGRSAALSVTVSFTHKYAAKASNQVEPWESDEPNHEQQLLLSQVLKPNREALQEVFRVARAPTFTGLVSTYCEHSEKTCHLLLLLLHSVHLARSLYAPIHDLVDAEIDSAHVPCNHIHAFEAFIKSGNPFPCPDSDYFLGMRLRFSALNDPLDHCLQKSGVRLERTTSSITICLSAHALVSLAATSVFPAFLYWKFTEKEMGKKEVKDMAKLDNARKSAYMINHDLDSIDLFVARLYYIIETDKCLISLGLNSAQDKEPIYEQLRKNRTCVLDHLTYLEELICLCFAGINRARSALLQGIHVQQTYFDYITQ